MEIMYDKLRFDDLQGTLLSDYLIALDARLSVVDEGQTLVDAPGFPVVELARSLWLWLSRDDREDFKFASMSFEEVGTVSLSHAKGGWTISSVLAPGSESAVHDWAAVEQCVLGFIARVEADLRLRDLDAAAVVRG